MMIITLPDSSQRQFEQAISVADIAANIGSGLAKVALAATVNGQLVDLSHMIDRDVQLSIITSKDEAGLEILRHSTAHLLAHAVKQLFPAVQVTIGPVIDEGFYYDFSFDRAFTPEDLITIEQRMHALVAQDIPIQRMEMDREAVIQFFRDQQEEYKVQIIEAIPEGEGLTLYQQGEFIDLCRGPHVPSTGKLGAFKLTKLAGAYWHGDSNNEMLQRIYGTAWATKKDLNAYLKRIEEAEKRDHRKLAKKLDLFHMQDEAPGMVFWHPNGWTIYQTIVHYLQHRLAQQDYQEINTPILVDRHLCEQSGHVAKFDDDMFATESENRTYLVKPMNCPCHVQVFKQGIKSYRDLPLRLAEFGTCHRNEPSGALHGLMRVRGFTQDDAHIFCSEAQILAETSKFIDLLYQVYHDFGFEQVIVKLSTRPDKRVGEDAQWDHAEAMLQQALDEKGIEWQLQPGEGAFYGPKIEFALKDCLERVWQCGTLQLDPFLPERLDAHYIDEQGERRPPVMLHRAIFGSLERFIGILLEHYAEGLPLWLAPQQIVVLNITDKQAHYCQQIYHHLKQQGYRVKIDLRNEKIGFKIREHTIQRIPYLLIVGDKELATQTITVRTREGKDLGTMTQQQLIEHLTDEQTIVE